MVGVICPSGCDGVNVTEYLGKTAVLHVGIVSAYSFKHASDLKNQFKKLVNIILN